MMNPKPGGPERNDQIAPGAAPIAAPIAAPGAAPVAAPIAAPIAAPAAASAQTPEQLRFAAWLEWGGRVGLLWLVVSFALDALGLLPAGIAQSQGVELWRLPLAEYLQATQAATGWSWLAGLTRGEGLSLAGIAVLAGCVLPGLLATLPLYLKRGDRVYAALCMAQVAVLGVAASGLLSSGH